MKRLIICASLCLLGASLIEGSGDKKDNTHPQEDSTKKKKEEFKGLFPILFEKIKNEIKKIDGRKVKKDFKDCGNQTCLYGKKFVAWTRKNVIPCVGFYLEKFGRSLKAWSADSKSNNPSKCPSQNPVVLTQQKKKISDKK